MDDTSLAEANQGLEELLGNRRDTAHVKAHELSFLQHFIERDAQPIKGYAKMLSVNKRIEHPDDVTFIVWILSPQELEDFHFQLALPEIGKLAFE